MRKLRDVFMAALVVAVLWGATIPAQDVPQCCKEQKACCQDGKACCPKKNQAERVPPQQREGGQTRPR